MNRAAEVSPAEERERRRQGRRARAERQIAFNGRCFLLLQLIAIGAFMVGNPMPFPTRSSYGGLAAVAVFLTAWLFSLFFAGRSAFVVVTNLDLLEGAWWAIGLAPWVAMMLPTTLLLAPMLL
ncbi:MAG: hypothetical protein M3552_08555 [Planctomycetota bacterium]|nr:hypothetical protein [Planctomycetaceae bacterium]MDQ3330691.1 hypothetical protein [Planctomycetota bacterium]